MVCIDVDSEDTFVWVENVKMRISPALFGKHE